MNIDKQTFNTLDVLYDDKKWGKRIDPDEWNANFKVLEEGHNELATKLNRQVTDIDIAIQASTSNGGQNISVQYGVGTETLQAALDNVVSDINNRYTKNEVDASIGSNTNSLIANAEYNESTGVFTFTRKDGSSVVIDTVIEKVPASMALVNESDGSVSLVVTNQDGSTTKTNVTSLIEDTVINSSDTINATSVTDAVKKVTTYTLVIKPNSIGLSHIDSALTAKFEETQSAKTAAIQAKDNAVAAQNAAVIAKNSAETYASSANIYSTNASVSADESADSALEAKGYAEQAASYKNSAELAKVAAEKARDEAQGIAGGDYVTKTEFNEHANNVDIHVTADEKAAWSEKEIFIITLTKTTDEDGETIYSADKTFDEIKAANGEGKMCLLYFGGFIFPLSSSNLSYANFVCLNGAIAHRYMVSKNNFWSKFVYSLVPSVTKNDNGKTLQVVNGAWAAVNNLSTVSTATLLASNWDSTAKTYSFETDYPSANYDIEVALDSTATSEQAEVFNGAQIVGSATSNIIKAYGDLPTVDIPVIIKVVTK